MSCMLTSPTTICRIATFLQKLLENDSYFGFCPPSSLYDALSDCRWIYGQYPSNKIYQKLTALNLDAYQHRYPQEQPFVYPAFDAAQTITRPAKIAQYTYVVQPWHFQMLKHIDFYLYQCCENNACHTAFYAALEETKQILATFILTHLPQYIEAEWN